MAHLALVDQLLHRAHGILDRHLGVDAMQPVNIDHFDAEPLERSITRLRYVSGVPRGEPFRKLEPAQAHVPEFRGEEHPAASAFDRAPDQFLVASRSVGVRSDDQVDAEIDGAVNRRDRLGLIRLAVDSRHSHAAQAQRRDGGPIFSELACVHALLSLWSFAEPVPGAQEIPIEFSFRARGVRSPVITPLHERGQGHQYRLGAAGRLQAEQRAAIIDEIELHVAAAAIGLEVSLALAVRNTFAALDDGNIGGNKMVADAASKLEARVETALVQIVEENPADAAWLAAVLEIEVLVAPAFETGIVVGAESLERPPARGIKGALNLPSPGIK